MKSRPCIRAAVALLSFGLIFAATARASDTSAAPAGDQRAVAKAAFETARGLFSSDINASVAGIRKAIDLDPDYFEAHQYYILYSGVAASRGPGTDDEKRAAAAKVSQDMETLYLGWAQEHPDKAVYQCALGTIFEYKDPDRAQRCFEQAVNLDPKFGAAYDSLAICAEVRGKLELARDYNRRAVEAEPDNVGLWRHYVGSFVNDDIDRGVAAGMEMAKRFPDGAASIIGYLATRCRDEAKARQVWELLREKFPVASAGNLPALFSIYLKTDPAKAIQLARDMSALVPDNKLWPVLVGYAQPVIDTDRLIADGKAVEARAALDKIVLPRYGADRRALDLAKARATAAGEGGAAKAYAELMAIFTKSPNDEVHAALVGYGTKLGKTPAAVEGEVMAQRDAAARAGVPFTLVNYRTGKPVSLDDYKGRVVLVNFWYPMCGPCRGEFPFLNAVLDKYRSRGFEILAINGHAPEDHMVLPLLDGWKLGFLPLNGKGDDGAAKDYKVRGFPSNFLYGPDGRIFYEPPPVSTLSAQRELELQIEALLDKNKA
jgi:Tfp pilus assembly protein PilF/thiol-disulfide isomerase/thioredoxin